MAFIKSAVYRRLAAADLVIALIPRRLFLRHWGCRHPVHSARRGGPAALPSRSSAPYSRRNCQFMNSSEDDRPGSDDFRFPCRFPAKPSIIAEPNEQVYDLTGVLGIGKPRKKFFSGFSCAAGNGRGGVAPVSAMPRRCCRRLGSQGLITPRIIAVQPAPLRRRGVLSAPAQLPGLGAPLSANRPCGGWIKSFRDDVAASPSGIRVGPVR